MKNSSTFVNQKLSSKELFPDIRQQCESNKVPLVSLDTALYLAQLVKIHNPKSILELGTATGYSANYLFHNFTGTNFVTVELSKDNIVFAKKNLNPGIALYEGDALDFLKDSKDLFDFVFVDARKKDYLKYFELLKPRLAAGAVIVFDNIFWHGVVTGESQSERFLKAKPALLSFLDRFLADSDFDSTIISVGDGLATAVLNSDSEVGVSADN